jgi:hypothetical protein
LEYQTSQLGGEDSNGKIPFPLMKKGRNLSDAEDIGMVPRGALVTEMWVSF